MPHNLDDQLPVTLPRFGVVALQKHAKSQAKALLVLADSPVKGMKRKADARREEAQEWLAVAGRCTAALLVHPEPTPMQEAL